MITTQEEKTFLLLHGVINLKIVCYKFLEIIFYLFIYLSISSAYFVTTIHKPRIVTKERKES